MPIEQVLLLHAGITDSRMWSPQIRALEDAGFRVDAPDLRGHGERPLEPGPFSHVRDVERLLDGHSAVVGNSVGGRVALELALHRPERVARLVLVAPGLGGWEWSDGTKAGWAEEEEAFERGDWDAAAEVSLRLWVDGPNRSRDSVDPELRAAVRDMVLRSYELDREDAFEEPLDPPLRERLREIACPTLVLVGEEDVADMKAIARHVAASIPGARLEVIGRTAHLPSLERPAEVNALLLRFLREG